MFDTVNTISNIDTKLFFSVIRVHWVHIDVKWSLWMVRLQMPVTKIDWNATHVNFDLVFFIAILAHFIINELYIFFLLGFRKKSTVVAEAFVTSFWAYFSVVVMICCVIYICHRANKLWFHFDVRLSHIYIAFFCRIELSSLHVIFRKNDFVRIAFCHSISIINHNFEITKRTKKQNTTK